MNDIIVSAPLGPRVDSVRPMDDYRLFIAFDNGEHRIFDAKPLLSDGVFSALQNKAFFEMVKVVRGSILWPNDIDYCPDTLYIESIPTHEDITTQGKLTAVAEPQRSYE